MNNIVYDRVTKQIKGYDRDPLPFESEIKIPYPIQLSKTIQESTGNLIQKVNDEGLPLYKKEIVINAFGEVTYTETVDAKTVIEFGTKPNIYRIATNQTTTEMRDVLQLDGTFVSEEVEVPVYDTIAPISEIPIVWEDHEPIIIEETVNRAYTLEQNCYIFSVDEVVEAIANATPPITALDLLQSQLAAQNQTQSDFMDYIFISFPDIS